MKHDGRTDFDLGSRLRAVRKMHGLSQRAVACVVVRGSLEAVAGGERRILAPGDAFYFDAGIPHRVRDTGSEACELVCAVTPPSF